MGCVNGALLLSIDVSGPCTQNQRIFLRKGICRDIEKLFELQRKDEEAFRNLMADNEDLRESWMDLCKTMRLMEIAILRFLYSLLEEDLLNVGDDNFLEKQQSILQHKNETIRRMVEEMNPRTMCRKIITHWNLSSEGADDQMKVPHIDDAAFLPTTEGDIIRPKTEIESKVT